MKYRSNYQKIPNYKYKNGQFYTQEIQTQQLLWTEEMLLQGWCFSLITGFLRHTEIHIWRQGTKRTQRGSIQRNPVMGQETMGTSWNTGNAALAKPWRRQSTGCPRRLGSLLLGDLQKQPGHGQGLPCLSRGWSRWTKRSLPASSSLWLCENASMW